MLAPGQYSDTLRALGRFIEILGGLELKIVDQGEYLELSWLGRSGARDERRWRAHEIEAVRTTTRLFRTADGGTPGLSTTELLRTVGWELDDKQAADVTIMEGTDGFWVSAQVGSERFGQLYTHSDLVARSREYHRRRLADEDTVEAPPAAG